MTAPADPRLAFLEGDAPDVAPRLIGWRLLVSDGVETTGGPIIEVEAYTQDDAASHAHRGPTPRNATMFGPAGRLYVYFSYGVHWCVNVVTGPEGSGQGVLIRGIEPRVGLETMRMRRGHTAERPRPDRHLTNGPGKVCQALGITGADDGVALGGERVWLEPSERHFQVTATERIGITRDAHRLWRFVG